MNTILNIVPQGEIHVVERLGKLHSMEQSGWFIAIPFIDNIAYIIDMRERSIEIPAQSAITRVSKFGDDEACWEGGNGYGLLVCAVCCAPCRVLYLPAYLPAYLPTYTLLIAPPPPISSPLHPHLPALPSGQR